MSASADSFIYLPTLFDLGAGLLLRRTPFHMPFCVYFWLLKTSHWFLRFFFGRFFIFGSIRGVPVVLFLLDIEKRY